jgi:hypothetical protein
MSHLVFVLVLGFIVWQWLAKRLRSAKAARPDAGRSSSPRSATADDVQVDEIAEVAAAVVSGFLGKKGEDMLEQAVGRAMRDSKAGTGIGRRPTDAVERASKKAAAQAPAKRRTKYLLDGDGGFRQRTDRTAKLQQSFRGKGLCSPR